MNRTDIKAIDARVILNSKGKKTIETDVYTEEGFGRASAPAGTSAGKNEVKQTPQKPEKLIKKAKKHLYPKIIGLNSAEQEQIDEKIKETDGTEKLENYGAGTTLPLSIAAAKAAASSKNIPLHHHLGKKKEYTIPQPLGKCIGGGSHAEKGPEIQEFLAIPTNTDSFKESILANVQIREKVKELLKQKDKNHTGGRDLESGYTTTLTNEECLEIMNQAQKQIEEEKEIDMEIGIDIAASEIHENGKYIYNNQKRTPDEQLEYIKELIEKYNILYIEDPFQEEDFEKHAELTDIKPDKVICGDDIFTTNTKRLEEGIKKKACNTILIKPNQVGTLTDTRKTIKRAKKEKYTTVISHRSGETNDSFISHLAVAYDIPTIKIGITGGERVAKTNELIRIEKYLGG